MDTRETKSKDESMKTKTAKSKEKKQTAAKLFRKKSFKSVGSLMNKILKTLGTWAHVGDAEPVDGEDDDGGFRDGTPCTLSANSGYMKEDTQVTSERLTKKSLTLSSRHVNSLKDRLSLSYGDKTPGVLGLKNHGNTCFMNAVVQCLSNTDLLAEYLCLERYKLDFSERRVNGIVKTEDMQSAQGEVTEQLASLVRALWTLEYTPQLSVEFKSIVSKYGSQFRGNSQHDALEFLLWLLDRVHEDVNPSSCTNNHNKCKTSGKGLAGPEGAPTGDTLVPQQPAERHSFVQEHFQAQYKSSLTCPHCLKQSNTFDPFLCISLPIPLRQTRPVYVTLVFSTKGQRYLRVGLAMPLFGSLACLRRMVADEGKISPDQVILAEIYSTGFQRSFFDEDDLTSVAENDIIYAFQASPLFIRGGSARISGYHHSLPSSPYSTSGPEGQRLPASGALSSEFLNQGIPGKVLLLVCNAAGSGQQTVRFGPPFLMREDRSVSWDQLQQSILSKLYYLMINGAQAQSSRVLFRIRVVGGSASYSYLCPQDGRPLCHPAVDRALKLCGSGGPRHVKLVVEWEHHIKDCLFGNIQEEVVKDAESVRSQQHQHVQQYSCTLDECFQLYTKEEQLAPDDAWKCPHCQQLQQGTVQMSLWTLPDILILHLKRFRQVGDRRNKLSTLVRFPLTGLDMAPHVVKRQQGAAPPHHHQSQQHPRNPQQQHQQQQPQDFLYDLYAVCNHHGGMHGGHYTAYCRNSVDGQWYSYDDSSVETVPDGEVCTRGAYILFYQRRNTIPPWSARSSLRGSSNSSSSDHWLIRLAGDSPPAPDSPVFLEQSANTDTEGFESKPLMRGTQGRSVSMRSPTRPSRDGLGRMLPLRWSFGSKDRQKPATPGIMPGELVEYLESGRRPRCTKEPIVPLVASPPTGKAQTLRRKPESSGSPSRSSPGRGAESPRVPEGQSRRLPSGPEQVCLSSRDDSSLGRRSSRRAGTRGAQDPQPQPSQAHPNLPTTTSTAPSNRDSTLRRAKAQQGPQGFSRTGSPAEAPAQTADHRTGTRSGEVGAQLKSSVSLLHKKRDQVPHRPREHEEKLSNVSLSVRPLFSNGSLTGAALEDKRTNGSALPFRGHCARHGKAAATPNGRKCQSSTATTAAAAINADIKRAHSSSSLQAKLDGSLRRTASLQRNGQLGPPALPHALVMDRPSYATLQRTRYSTTSLGRPRRVPESCF
ncbi:ubiquitin carboxyl-terminal hydrolase 43 [Alosa sapidissima]|uniref:ubiquitin carboxyl-terminal hydrolase 43 n=1 Tax=Alosa sapidissima TaxID=34773 RepID=UPI001C089F61|nr:ubiquitin carboxyl-terminal hydrolase 43 [Alosa sapidissima]